MILTKKLSKQFLEKGKAGAWFRREYGEGGRAFSLYFDIARLEGDQCIIVWQVLTDGSDGHPRLVDTETFTTEWEMCGEQVLIVPSYYDVAVLIAKSTKLEVA